jgi:F-type H+-transporting ATPase subunit c
MDIAYAQEATKAAVEVVKTMPIDGRVILKAVCYLGAGLCMGMGALGPGLGEGYIGGRACEGIARQPELQGQIIRTMLLADAVAETTGIYSLIIAILLLFVIAPAV